MVGNNLLECRHLLFIAAQFNPQYIRTEHVAYTQGQRNGTFLFPGLNREFMTPVFAEALHQALRLLGLNVRIGNHHQSMLSTMPPSTRRAAPVVALAWGEAA